MDEQGFEEWMRDYYCEMWWFEEDQTWTLRHTYPDHHTIRDVVAPTLHAAVEAAKGGKG